MGNHSCPTTYPQLPINVAQLIEQIKDLSYQLGLARGELELYKKNTERREE